MRPDDPSKPFVVWFSTKIKDYLDHLSDPKTNQFMTIVHSDLTNNNMMLTLSKADDQDSGEE